ALKEYSLGHDDHIKLRDTESVPHYKRAIALDPNFAMAYASLGVVTGNLNHLAEAEQYLSKAYELRDRTSEREKLYISTHYLDEFLRDTPAAIAAYEHWMQLYPRDSTPWDNAALSYMTLGQHEKAISAESQILQIEPKDSFANQNLAAAYMRLNRY